ncbi:putative N(6)-L-threonylcarbamoyladenine synthase [Sporobolomyces salmoneus]|uniref:putative N(6)-L-threonylcarbamoyladenine synthase n=1 Tax=Sporobolomyces salmoneus TaxID=183962 RepID=UPI0031734837
MLLRFHHCRSLLKPISARRFVSTQIDRKPLLVLGLESSADDSCASIVSSTREILSNVVLKQNKIHESFGGIHPLHAQEAHQRNLPLAIKLALEEAKVKIDDLDAIAFTRGPGMYGCLSVCAGAAKALAAASGKPLIGVHHMQAHALTPFLTASPTSPAPVFPFLTLLLSGGHTLLLLCTSPNQFRILATTHDESIGQSFDKAARDLEIPWELGKGSPGAALESFAFTPLPDSPTPSSTHQEVTNYDFPIPFRNQLSFSYAGLRSALTRMITTNPVETMSLLQKQSIAKGFMVAAFKQVEEKLAMGLRKIEQEEGIQVEGLVVSGGVASNTYLRTQLRAKLDQLSPNRSIPLHFPPPALCTDNAAMIAWVGIGRLERGRIDELEVMQKSKWGIEDCEADFEDREEKQ